MRAAAVSVVLAMLLLASVCSASLYRYPKAMKKAGTADPPQGTAYALVSRLIAALHFKNYTQAGSLLADDGFFMVSDIACDGLNKTQLLNAAMSEQLAASQVILGEWVESTAGITIIKAQVGAVFGAGSPLANQSYYNPNVFIVALPSMDGTQLAVFERFTDASWRQQNNASDMLRVWNTIVAADEVGDITPWQTLVTSDFSFSLYYAWNEYSPVTSNATAFLDTLMHTYHRQQSASIKVGTVFPVCELVLADFMAFKQNKDGSAFVQKFFIALRITSDFKLKALEEYAASYF